MTEFNVHVFLSAFTFQGEWKILIKVLILR